MMLIASSILVFASTFVTQMANNYGDTEMATEYALRNISLSNNEGLFSDLKGDIESSSQTLQSQNKSTGLWSLGSGVLDVVSNVLYTFLTAPNRLGDLVEGALSDMGVGGGIASTIKWTIVLGIWIVIIFAIITAFLQGAKV